MASTPTSPLGTDWRTSTWSSRWPGRRSSIHSPGPRPSGTQALSGSPSRAWEARAPTSSKKREEERATTRPEAPASRSTTGSGSPGPAAASPLTAKSRAAGSHSSRSSTRSSSWKRLPASPAALVRTTSIGAESSRARSAGGRATASLRRVWGRRATWRTWTPGTPISQKPTGLSPTPRTWVISTVTVEVVASGTSTLTSGSAGTGTSTAPASTRTRTPATWTPSDWTGRRTTSPTSAGFSSRRVTDWPTAPPKSPVVQAVRRSPSKASSGLPNGVAVSSEPDPVAVTAAAPSRRVTVWVPGSPNRLRVEVGRGWSARSVGEWFWPVRKLPQARRRLLSVTTTRAPSATEAASSSGVTEPSSRNAGSPGASPSLTSDGRAKLSPSTSIAPWAGSARVIGRGRATA